MSEIPRVQLKQRRSQPFLNRHPWVFQGAIAIAPQGLEPGSVVTVCTHKNEPIAQGLWNPRSNFRTRLYVWSNQAEDVEQSLLTPEFWQQKIKTAISLRRQLFPNWDQAALRLINSEGDGLSGLTVDWFAGWLVVQFTSLGLWTVRDVLLTTLQDEIQPRGILLKADETINNLEGMELEDQQLSGETPLQPLFITENEISFGVDLVAGQKTGFFCDQRDNRRRCAELLKSIPEARVMDAFCYSGGFGLAALVHGNAKRVTFVDTSEAALHLAQANAELNSCSNRSEFVQGKALHIMRDAHNEDRQYDAIVLDPPKLAKNRGSLERAMGVYAKLNEAALRLIKPGGLLVTCSCSGHVSRQLFAEMLAQTATNADRQLRILEQRGAATDHPVSANCLEGEYLKTFFCHVQ